MPMVERREVESQTSRVCLDRRTTQRFEGEAGLAGATGRDGYNMRQGERKEPAVSNRQRRHVVVEQRSPGKLTTGVGTHGFEHMIMDIWHQREFLRLQFHIQSWLYFSATADDMVRSALL